MKKYLWSVVIMLVFIPFVFAMPTKQPTVLSWTAPTTNIDGTSIINLAGYRVYWSTTSGSYTDIKSKDVGNVVTTTTQAVTGSATTVYFFVVTAYNTSGKESGFSNEVQNAIPLVPGVPGNLGIQ